MRVLLLLWLSVCSLQAGAEERIDRRAVVARHSIHFERFTPEAPASLGNGNFAFTFDITGLQTFPSDAPGHLPLCTMSDWGWHSFPLNDMEFRYEETLRDYDASGRKVSYATDMRSEAAKYFRANPHRFNLGRISFRLLHSDGSRAKIEDIKNPRQTVDLWNGEAKSTFDFEGEKVEVTTIVHPTLDAVAIAVKSALLSKQQLSLELTFSYPAGEWGPKVDDWSHPDKHSSLLETRPHVYSVSRVLDSTKYTVVVFSSGKLVAANDARHTFLLQTKLDAALEAVINFRRAESDKHQNLVFQETQELANLHWREFWEEGGIVDLSQSEDERWKELERRIVLSQFLTAIQCSGNMPPQETGLVCNSWFGKSHLEMHWWHAAHFALWRRSSLLERSLKWYHAILPAAKRIADRQGYSGVRWPKMTGPEGISSPSEVGELLVWQQPHPIYFAELIYRTRPNVETLKRYQDLVEETARFMADYAEYEESNDRYVLGPVLIPAQECYNGREKPGVLNPTFELAYWRWGLRTANNWRARLGLAPIRKWQDVERKISVPHEQDGVYTAIENAPFTNRRDHPSMLAALGVLPDVGLIAPSTMSRTLDDVLADWDWPDTWGWDYPMMAMTAARLGRPEDAIDCLLMDAQKNSYLPNGHCRQEDRLPIYLPANGGLLTAVGMMCAGWDQLGQGSSSPGFPSHRWHVLWEDIDPMP